MEDTKQYLSYIFYLQTKSELDANYFHLSEIFSKMSITLLPIQANELRVLDKTTKNHLIVIRNDLASNNIFVELRKSYLDIAMMTSRIKLFDISSFSEIEITQKLANKDLYKFTALPADFKEIAMNIAVDYFQVRNKRDEWPGGKRAKLPSITSSN
jgi:hypothetical protein